MIKKYMFINTAILALEAISFSYPVIPNLIWESNLAMQDKPRVTSA